MTALPDWFDLTELTRWLRQRGQEAWAETIVDRTAERLARPSGGQVQRWADALAALPPAERGELEWDDTGVRVVGPPADPEQLRQSLMEFHPWRKGPLEFFGMPLDTEWRSDWKWRRMASAVEWRGRSVLDVGSGNGYYGWRMLASGADFVLGIDPTLRYVLQYEAFARYAARPRRHFVVPLSDADLPEKLAAFDIVVSAGVLYHRTGPIDHLRTLAASLAPGGHLILETLVVEDDEPTVLVPRDRYAQMRNVWFLPSIAMLQRWLERTGFQTPRLLDVTRTSTAEQRSTAWMTFQSLADFLDPQDPSKTIEGYPAPTRALLVAQRR